MNAPRIQIAAALVMVAMTLSSLSRAQGRDIEQKKSREYLQQADDLLAKGKEREAEQQLEKAIATDPKNTEAFKRYAAYLLKKQRFAETQRLLEQGLEHNPRDPYLEAYLAVCYCWTGKPKQALQTFKRVEPHIARVGVMQFLVAECLLYNGNYALAAQTLGPSMKKPPSKGDVLERSLRLRYAAALLKMGDLAGAAREIGRLPQSRQVLPLKAELLLRRGKCGIARDIYKKLISESVGNLLGLAEAEMCLGRNQQALDEINRYLSDAEILDYQTRYLAKRLKHVNRRLIRQVARAVSIRGDIQARLKRHGQAVESYQLAGQLGLPSRELDLKVSTAYFHMAQYDQCLERLSSRLEDAEVPRPFLRLAVRAAVRAGKNARALSVADKLLKKPELTARDHYIAGVAYKSSGRFLSAIKTFEKALAESPTSKQIQLDLAATYVLRARREALKGNLPQAIVRLKQVLEIPAYRTSAPAIHANLALLYVKSGQGEPALTHARKAQGHPRARWLAGRALALLGRHEEALKYYNGLLAKRDALADQVLVDAAIALLHLGKIQQSIDLLDGADSRAPRVRQNLTRACYLMGTTLLEQKQVNMAWKYLLRALEGSMTLPEHERVALLGRIFMASLTTRRITIANRLIANHQDELARALKDGFRSAGQPLITALVEVHSTDPQVKLKIAKNLLALARPLSKKEAEQLRSMGSILLRQVSHLYLGQGNARTAQAHLSKSMQITGRTDPSIKHNMAVAMYRAGKITTSLKALHQLAPRIPLATCNLAAHEDNRGNAQRAYELFKQCHEKGGAYPRLEKILDLKRRIFGP